jgi:hypothetical protein
LILTEKGTLVGLGPGEEFIILLAISLIVIILTSERLAAASAGASWFGNADSGRNFTFAHLNVRDKLTYIQDVNSTQQVPEQLGGASAGADSFSIISRAPPNNANQSTLDSSMTLR